MAKTVTTIVVLTASILEQPQQAGAKISNHPGFCCNKR